MDRTWKATVGVSLAAAFALMALSGCSAYDDKRGMGDAPVAGKRGDDSPAEVFNFPDGFGNIATKCVGHGNRAYVTTNSSAPSNLQIVKDSSCQGTP